MTLPITAFYAGILALWLVWLAFMVGGQRRASRVSVGDGGDQLLLLRIRGHGNAVETIPIALILLALSENMGAPGWMLHCFGASLVAGRVMHGIHFLKERESLALRMWGMILTVTPIFLMALGLIGHAIPEIF
ncbi:MAPEG family protein [Rhodobacteraceae bacterium NNCM2]|nr:MAPEG family protein [Coraliihabitans acroporae]